MASSSFKVRVLLPASISFCEEGTEAVVEDAGREVAFCDDFGEEVAAFFFLGCVVVGDVVVAVSAFLVFDFFEPVAGTGDVEPAAEHVGCVSAVEIWSIAADERAHLFLRQGDVGDVFPFPQRRVLDLQEE